MFYTNTLQSSFSHLYCLQLFITNLPPDINRWNPEDRVIPTCTKENVIPVFHLLHYSPLVHSQVLLVCLSHKKSRCILNHSDVTEDVDVVWLDRIFIGKLLGETDFCYMLAISCEKPDKRNMSWLISFNEGTLGKSEFSVNHSCR